MKLLLDTHIAIWAFADDKRLSRKARKLINDSDNEIYVSVASLWEVLIKHSNHPDKLTITSSVMERCCDKSGFEILDIMPKHVNVLRKTEEDDKVFGHKDPIDKMIL